jgi:type 1 fimbria pilin
LVDLQQNNLVILLAPAAGASVPLPGAHARFSSDHRELAYTDVVPLCANPLYLPGDEVYTLTTDDGTKVTSISNEGPITLNPAFSSNFALNGQSVNLLGFSTGGNGSGGGNGGTQTAGCRLIDQGATYWSYDGQTQLFTGPSAQFWNIPKTPPYIEYSNANVGDVYTALDGVRTVLPIKCKLDYQPIGAPGNSQMLAADIDGCVTFVTTFGPPPPCNGGECNPFCPVGPGRYLIASACEIAASSDVKCTKMTMDTADKKLTISADPGAQLSFPILLGAKPVDCGGDIGVPGLEGGLYSDLSVFGPGSLYDGCGNQQGTCVVSGKCPLSSSASQPDLAFEVTCQYNGGENIDSITAGAGGLEVIFDMSAYGGDITSNFCGQTVQFPSFANGIFTTDSSTSPPLHFYFGQQDCGSDTNDFKGGERRLTEYISLSSAVIQDSKAKLIVPVTLISDLAPGEGACDAGARYAQLPSQHAAVGFCMSDEVESVSFFHVAGDVCSGGSIRSGLTEANIVTPLYTNQYVQQRSLSLCGGIPSVGSTAHFLYVSYQSWPSPWFQHRTMILFGTRISTPFTCKKFSLKVLEPQRALIFAALIISMHISHSLQRSQSMWAAAMTDQQSQQAAASRNKVALSTWLLLRVCTLTSQQLVRVGNCV